MPSEAVGVWAVHGRETLAELLQYADEAIVAFVRSTGSENTGSNEKETPGPPE
jgi:hypothetical protein